MVEKQDKLLISWIGQRDPFTKGTKKGPILSLLSNKGFDRCIFLHTPELSEKAQATLKEIKTNNTKKNIEKISLKDPRDYTEIFLKVKHKVAEIIKDLNDNTQIFVYLDPGTAQMKTAWILLVLSGILPAKLLQGTEPGFNSGKYKINEVYIEDLSFPGIKFEKENRDIHRSIEVYQNQKQKLLEKFSEITGQHPEMLNCFERALLIAPYNENVLITGESGTGKELLSRKIHDLSNRIDGPFISINCAAIPESIFESEMFGYKKGAFTGATGDKTGLIESANGGTLFLDEIAEMPLFFQAKLLRVLQDRKIKRVGDTEEVDLDFRLICATNKDLKKYIKDLKFREDLYHRVNVIPIEIPPLRERRSDIFLLVDMFLDKYNRQYELNKKIDPIVYEKLVSYHWPGNVRELENTIKRFLLISTGDVVDDTSLIPGDESISCDYYREYMNYRKNTGNDFKEFLKEIEVHILKKTLKDNKGVASKAAKFLGENQHTLRARLKRYEIW